MVTKVGNDTFGKDYSQNYVDVGIHDDFVFVDEGSSTGVAPITVDASAENSILIVPGP